MEHSFIVNIRPAWQEIETVRNRSLRFFQANNFPEPTIDSVVMVIGELLENAIKYGSFMDKDSTITLLVSLAGGQVSIDVIHPVDNLTMSHLTKLDRTIQWIRGYHDPFEAYTERLKEVAEKAFTDPTSELGLVRIAYEGNSIVDFFVNERSMLDVSAVLILEEEIHHVH